MSNFKYVIKEAEFGVGAKEKVIQNGQFSRGRQSFEDFKYTAHILLSIARIAQ